MVNKRLHTRTQQIISWSKVIFNNLIILMILLIAIITNNSDAIIYEVVAALIGENMAFIAFLRHLNLKGDKLQKTKKE